MYGSLCRRFSTNQHLALTCATTPSFNHLVGAGKQRSRHFNAEHLGGPKINDQLELVRLFDRKIGGLGTFEDFIDLSCGAPI
jgi:hypothetical protein